MSSSGKRVACSASASGAEDARNEKRARNVENPSTLTNIDTVLNGEPPVEPNDPFELSEKFPELPQADRLMWELAASGVDTISFPATMPRGFQHAVLASVRGLYNVGGTLMNHKVPYSTSQMQDDEDSFTRRSILQEQLAYMSTQTIDFIPACDPMKESIVAKKARIRDFLDVVRYEIQMACQKGHATRLGTIEQNDTRPRRHMRPPEARKGVVWLLLPTAEQAKHCTMATSIDYLDAFSYLASSQTGDGTRLSQRFRFAVACNGVGLDGQEVNDANEVMKFFKLTPFPKSDHTHAALLVATIGPKGEVVHQLVDLSKHLPETSLSRSVARSTAWESRVGRYTTVLISTLTFTLEAVGLHDHVGALLASIHKKEPQQYGFLIEQSLAARRFYDMLDLKPVDFVGDEEALEYLSNVMQPSLSNELFAQRKQEAKQAAEATKQAAQQAGGVVEEEDEFVDDDELETGTEEAEEVVVSPYAPKLVCAGFLRMTERGLLLTEALKHTNGVREEQMDYIQQEKLIRDNVRSKLNRFEDEDDSALRHYATNTTGLYESMPVQVWCDPSYKKDVTEILCNSWCLDYSDSEVIEYLRQARVVFCFLWSTYVNMRSHLGYYSIESCLKDAQPRPCEGLHMLQFKLAAPSSKLFYEYCMQPCRIDNLAPSNFYNVQAAQSRILQFENLLHQLGDEAVCPIYKYLQARNRLPPAWQPLQSSVALLVSNKANDANGAAKGDADFQIDEYGGGFDADFDGGVAYGVGSSTEAPSGSSWSISRPTNPSKFEVRDAANELLNPNQADCLKPLARLMSLMVRRFGPLVDMETAVGQLVEELNNNRVVLAKEHETYKKGHLTPLEAYSRLLG